MPYAIGSRSSPSYYHIPNFHWFRYDRYEHGFNLKNLGIDVHTHRTYDLRGGIFANQVTLLPEDLTIIGHRHIFGSRLRQIEQTTQIKMNRLYAAEKRLFPKIIAKKDISLTLARISPLQEYRLLLKNPEPEDIRYFRATFAEHYYYFDVNDRELLVLLMIQNEQARELESFIADRVNKIIFSGVNLRLRYGHLFNLADLEPEYDYDNNRWRDPFRHQDWWVLDD